MYTVDQSEADAIEAVEGVYLTQLAAGDRTSVQHYHFEPGSGVPAHAHEHEQVGFLYRGALTFHAPAGWDSDAEIDPDAATDALAALAEDADLAEHPDAETFVVAPGESYAVASDEPHLVENVGDDAAVGIDVFSPPRGQSPWE